MAKIITPRRPGFQSKTLLCCLLFALATTLLLSPTKAFSTARRDRGELIRVEVLRDLDSVSISGTKRGSIDLVTEAGVSMLADNDRSYKSMSFKAYDGFMEVNGKSYRNVIIVNAQKDGKGLQVINELPLEDYLVGLINKEISSKWHPDALKTQAIIARTYALTQMGKREGEPYHLKGTDIDQVYKGSGPEDRKSRRAVDATRGMVLYYKGALALTLYHSNAGGHTEAAKYVWGGEYPYLKGVSSKYDRKQRRFEWKYSIRADLLRSKLRKKGHKIDSKLKSLVVKKRSPSKRAIKLLIKAKPKNIVLTGEELRSLLGYSNLRSTMFKVKTKKGIITFTGKGSGHGVGLSQWGAKGMADAGRSYKRILKHYYPGTVIETLY